MNKLISLGYKESLITRVLFLVRVALAAVFLANGLKAIFSPNEFTDLIEKSFISNILSISVLLKIIAFNDIIMSVLILLSKKWRSVILGWGVLWIIGVMVVLGRPLDVLEESGFLFMALALLFYESSKQNV